MGWRGKEEGEGEGEAAVWVRKVIGCFIGLSLED